MHRVVDRIYLGFAVASCAIARAGAGTLAELAACELPTLLVPLPSSHGEHQVLNAQALSQATGRFSPLKAAHAIVADCDVLMVGYW